MKNNLHEASKLVNQSQGEIERFQFHSSFIPSVHILKTVFGHATELFLLGSRVSTCS